LWYLGGWCIIFEEGIVDDEEEFDYDEDEEDFVEDSFSRKEEKFDDDSIILEEDRHQTKLVFFSWILKISKC